MKPTNRPIFQVDIPAVSPVVGFAWLFVGAVYGLLVRAGALVVALWLAWGWGRDDQTD